MWCRCLADAGIGQRQRRGFPRGSPPSLAGCGPKFRQSRTKISVRMRRCYCVAELLQRCAHADVDGRRTGTPTGVHGAWGPNMHLNRWQIMIGVVASVCWFIGATIWIDVSVTDQLQRRAVSEYHDCQEKTPEDHPPCSAKFARDFRAAISFLGRLHFTL